MGDKATRDQTIVAMHKTGATQAAIVKAAGCSRATVNRVLAAHRKKTAKTPAMAKRIPELAEELAEPSEVTPPSFARGEDLGDEELKRWARVALVDRCRRLDDLGRKLDERLWFFLTTESAPSSAIRDYSWASAVTQDKLVAAAHAALLVGPSVAPRPVRAVFEAKVVDTPAPEGAPADGSAP